MAITVRVKVLRTLLGDKRYEPGDYRELAVADAERLEATGAVKIVSKAAHQKPKPARKRRGAKNAGAAPANKAEGRAPSNKAEGRAPSNKRR